jgi:exodeoxyribonuclease VIII
MQDFVDGWWDDVSEADYHASDIVSRGMLKTLRKSPAEFHARYVARTMTDRDTAALIFGRLLHTAVLEPERWERFITVRPDVDGRTKDGKAALAEWRATHTPETIVATAEQHALILAMSKEIASDKHASMLLSGAAGYRERAYRWHDPETGLPMRAKADVALERPVIVDLKSFGDVPTPEAFGGEAVRRWYHAQGAIYCDGAEAITGVPHRFVLVAINKKPPHEVAVYELDTEELDLGRREYRAALRELQQRREVNDWKAAWQREPQFLKFPGWAFRSSEEWAHG